jgi:hypothetical protein
MLNNYKYKYYKYQTKLNELNSLCGGDLNVDLSVDGTPTNTNEIHITSNIDNKCMSKPIHNLRITDKYYKGIMIKKSELENCGYVQDVILKQDEVWNYENLPIIQYDSSKAPHEIPLYRDMVRKYIGLYSSTISGENNNKRLDKQMQNNIVSSFYGKNLADNNTNNVSENEIMKTNFNNLTKNTKYRYISRNACWFPRCGGNSFMFEEENDPSNIILTFDVGGRVTDLDHMTFEPIIKLPLNNEVKGNYTFETYVMSLYTNLHKKKINKILLCGHSNGMAAATMTAYILLTIESDEFRNYYLSKGYTNELYNLIQNLPKLNLKDKICVCGTGGFPLLWNDEIDFKYFYETLKGRYLHLNRGIQFNLHDTIYIDGYMSTQHTSYMNYKFYIYYYLTYSKKTTYHNDDSSNLRWTVLNNNENDIMFAQQVHDFLGYRETLMSFF